MKKRKTFGSIAIAGVLGLALVACNGSDEQRRVDPMPRDGPAGGQEAGGMEGMPAMMQRHAGELDEMTERMRRHIEGMRQLSPEQQHERMGEHVTQVSQLLVLVNRQMREMDMGMGMTDEQMGRMMGMTGEEHRRMMQGMQALRAEVEQLQTASRPEVRQRMPAHLDRLERMTQMMERGAAAMRSM